MVNFLLLLKNVFNATSSENDYMVEDDIMYFYGMKNGVFSKSLGLSDCLSYSWNDGKWNFKDYSIDSFVVYVTLTACRGSLETE